MNRWWRAVAFVRVPLWRRCPECGARWEWIARRRRYEKLHPMDCPVTRAAVGR